jgi:hypothetical protein
MYLKPNGEQLQLEKDIRAAVDKDKLWKHVEYLCGLGEKFSGTPESKQAVDYFVESVREYDVPVEVYEFDSFLSYPSHDRSKDATLEVVAPSGIKVNCQSHAMSGSALLVECELVDVGPGDLKDYEGKDVEGKIVLVDFAALWTPERLYIAQQKGAVGQITISGDPVIHDMVVTTVWGTPTKESSKRIPKIPIVSITNEDGKRLRELCRNNQVRIKLSVDIWKGWKKVYLPVVHIEGREYPEKYFLVHGHFCSWGDGMTDNVGGNVHFIEMAKIFWKYRDHLKKGVKIAWWPGHSQGRYSGSTWFADQFWEDLNKNCFAEMNIDSPGVIGATILQTACTSELKQFNEYNMEELAYTFINSPVQTNASTGIFRAGDQSFTGIGISRIELHTAIPDGSPLKGKTTGGGGGGWWWHTLQDTIDKGDKDLLHLHLMVNMSTITRLCNAEILPFNFTPVPDDFKEVLEELHEIANGAFDVSPLIKKCSEMKQSAEALEDRLNTLMTTYATKNDEEKKPYKALLARVDENLMEIIHTLQPVFCTESGRFEQDPAIRIPPIPGLQPIRELAAMDQGGDDARFLKTGLVRQRNKVSHALSQAIKLMDAIEKE